ncbi:tyrosine-type recombinase/integrase [Mesorhizobium sp. M0243]|uniref:tyrosine-type recombinase/integrase n=1 Tax=Mesorhizobium sp. M0243 TaxID=2956925 RepID=UPI00333B4861
MSPEDQRAWVAASYRTIRDLISAALVTGARFGELARLRIADYDVMNKSVFIAESKSGKPRHVPLPEGGADLYASLAADRGAGDLQSVLESRSEGRKCARYHTARAAAYLRQHDGRQWGAADIVAQALGHSDARIAEQHYAHLAPSYIADTIRRLAPDI